jgi:hypothetical protein
MVAGVCPTADDISARHCRDQSDCRPAVRLQHVRALSYVETIVWTIDSACDRHYRSTSSAPPARNSSALLRPLIRQTCDDAIIDNDATAAPAHSGANHGLAGRDLFEHCLRAGPRVEYNSGASKSASELLSSHLGRTGPDAKLLPSPTSRSIHSDTNQAMGRSNGRAAL